jgi:hypothetical protein
MKKILEMIKDGFGIALDGLLLFAFRLVACLYYMAIPSAITAIIPALVLWLLSVLDVEYEFLIFKILLSLSQIVALPMTLFLVDSDENIPNNDSGKMFIPSKDLVVAVYVIFNLYVWGILKV